MRTTLTLEDDVAAKLQAEVRRTGKSLKETVNELLRVALARPRRRPSKTRFKVKARDLGALAPGLNLDDVAGLLEQVEGPAHR